MARQNEVDHSPGDHPWHPPAGRAARRIPYCYKRFLPLKMGFNDLIEKISRQKVN